MAAGSERDATSVLDVGELDRVFGRIEERERRRSVEHAAQLADLITLARITRAAGMELMTVAQIALALNSSERRAESLLAEAIFLDGLGALAVMADGLLTIEQAAVVIDLLRPVDDELAAVLWHKLAERLAEDRRLGVVRPPSRLRELLRRWVIAADPEGYEQRRRSNAEADADVQCWQRDDGLVDLVGRALSAADAQACMDRIEHLAQPAGPDDTRSAGERRRRVMIDLLTGRLILPSDQNAAGDSDAAVASAADAGVGCCPPGSLAPCGAEVFVHVPLATADAVAAGGGATDGDTVDDRAEVVPGVECEPRLWEPAELVGYGPIDSGALTDLLLSDPVLHRVWVDANGVPVAVDDQVWRPGRDDPDGLRRVLEELAHGPPPDTLHPVHPDDHDAELPAVWSPHSGDSQPRVLTRPHLGDPGPYVPNRRQKRLVRARAPRCEWPGCGRRASRGIAAACDVDHDLAWPYGPTCACQMGPLCRRHHRVKQLGWFKRRNPDGSIRWTGPTGRSWTNPSQHPRPTPRRSREAEPRALPPGVHKIAPGVWQLPSHERPAA